MPPLYRRGGLCVTSAGSPANPSRRLTMTFNSRRRAFISAIAVAGSLATPAVVYADVLPESFSSDAAQSGYKGTLPSPSRGDAAQIDADEANRALTTIEVVRPERTIVREVDGELPLIIS